MIVPVGLEAELPVVMEILDQKRVVEVDDHREIIPLRQIEVAQMAVEQDPIVPVRLSACPPSTKAVDQKSDIRYQISDIRYLISPLNHIYPNDLLRAVPGCHDVLVVLALVYQ